MSAPVRNCPSGKPVWWTPTGEAARQPERQRAAEDAERHRDVPRPRAPVAGADPIGDPPEQQRTDDEAAEEHGVDQSRLRGAQLELLLDGRQDGGQDPAVHRGHQYRARGDGQRRPRQRMGARNPRLPRRAGHVGHVGPHSSANRTRTSGMRLPPHLDREDVRRQRHVRHAGSGPGPRLAHPQAPTRALRPVTARESGCTGVRVGLYGCASRAIRAPPSAVARAQRSRCARIALAWARGFSTIWSRFTCEGRVAANAITSATSSAMSGVIPW